jgi:hypothetical protein
MDWLTCWRVGRETQVLQYFVHHQRCLDHIHNCAGNGGDVGLVMYINNGNNSLQVLESRSNKCFVSIWLQNSYDILNVRWEEANASNGKFLINAQITEGRKFRTVTSQGLFPAQPTHSSARVRQGTSGAPTSLRIIKTNSVALSPQANYTDWATATCRRNLMSTFEDRGGVAWSARRIPYGR